MRTSPKIVNLQCHLVTPQDVTEANGRAEPDGWLIVAPLGPVTGVCHFTRRQTPSVRSPVYP